jgi:hypothetical protein
MVKQRGGSDFFAPKNTAISRDNQQESGQWILNPDMKPRENPGESEKIVMKRSYLFSRSDFQRITSPEEVSLSR